MCWVKESSTTAKGFRKWRFCLPCPSCSWLLCNFHSQEPALYKASSTSAPSEVFQSTSSKDCLLVALLHCNSDIGSSTLFPFLSTTEQLVSSPLAHAFRMFKCRTKPQSPSNLVIRAILLSGKTNHQVLKGKKELPRGVEHGWRDRHNFFTQLQKDNDGLLSFLPWWSLTLGIAFILLTVHLVISAKGSMCCHFSDKGVNNNTVEICFCLNSGQSEHLLIKMGLKVILTVYIPSSQNLQRQGLAPAALKKALSPWQPAQSGLCFHQAQKATAWQVH